MDPGFQPSWIKHNKLMIYAVSVLVLLILLGWFCVEWRAGKVDEEMRAQLLRQVVRIAQAVNPELVKELSFTPADKGSLPYERLREQMTAYGRLLWQRGIYSMTLRHGKLFFGPENYEEGDPMASPPGTLYENPAPEAYEIFSRRKPVTVGPVTDEYGTFVTAFAPVLDPRTGDVLMVVGMDILADDWRAAVSAARLPPAAMTLFLALLVLGCAVGIYRRNNLSVECARPLRHMETVMVGVLGLALTVVTTLVVIEAERGEEARVFVEFSDSKAEAIRSIFRGICEDLASIARFFEASQRVRRQEFAAFVEPLARNAVVEGYQWVELVRQGERSRYESEAVAEAPLDLAIWEKSPEGERVTASARPAYFPVRYAAPGIGSEADMGFDMSSRPLWSSAFDQAACAEFWIPADPVSVVFDGTEAIDILAVRPVFRAENGDEGFPDDGGGSQLYLRGFVTGRLRLQSFLEAGLKSYTAESPLLEAHLLGLMDPRRPKLLAAYPHARTDDRHLIMGKENLQQDPLSQVLPVFAFGRTFALALHPASGFYASNPLRQGLLAGFAGLIGTAVLTLFVGFLRNRQARLEAQVLERTTALRESEERFRALFENSMSGVALCEFVLDEQGGPADYIYLHANPAFEAHTGLRVAEILGKRASEVQLGIETMSFLQRYGKALMRGEPVAFELFLEKEQRHFNVIAHFMDEGRFAFTLSNITEQKRVEETARELAERLQYYFTVSPVIIYIFKMQGPGRMQPVWVSENIENLLGYTAREALSADWWTMHLHPEDVDGVMENMSQLMEKGRLTQEYRFLGKDGATFWIRDQLRVTRCANSPAKEVVGAWIDITEQKRAESEFKKLEVQFHQAQKMEAVGRLAGGVAHDFNNMLGVILGYIELALMDLDDLDPIRHVLEEVKSASHRSADLVRQLLAFARRQVANPVPLNLNETVENMLKMLCRLIGEDIDLVWVPGHGLWNVQIDPSQFDQVLANLLVNARDAIDGVGKVTIQTNNVVLDETFCANHAGCVPGEYVLLALSDDGCGMELGMQAKVFEPFFTTKELGKGTGLGLSTVFGIIKQNRGYINLCSEKGCGSTFSIYLPRFQSGTADCAADMPSDPALPKEGTETVLIVEDENAILELAGGMLRRLGYSVLSAGTPGDAIRRVQEYPGLIDLLITDVVMPEMNGRELAKRLEALQPDMKCLYMSGYTADVIAHQGILDQGVRFLQKPFAAKALSDKVAEALGH